MSKLLNYDNETKISLVEIDSGRNIFYSYYENKSELLSYLPEQDPKKSFSSSILHDKDWSGTDNYKEAVNRFIRDDAKQYETFSKTIDDVKSLSYTKAVAVKSVEGYQPLVPHYLMGLPLNMRNKKKIGEVPTINFIIDPGVDYSISSKTIETIGASIFNKMIELEEQKVKFNVLLSINATLTQTAVKGLSTLATSWVKIKNADERLDKDDLVFSLVNVATQRRIGFRWIEYIYNGKGMYEGYEDLGYGWTLDTESSILKELYSVLKQHEDVENSVILRYEDLWNEKDVQRAFEDIKEDLKDMAKESKEGSVPISVSGSGNSNKRRIINII